MSSKSDRLDFHLITLYVLMDSTFWFDTIILGWYILYIEGSQIIISKYNFNFFSEDSFMS